eukprot:976647_1
MANHPCFSVFTTGTETLPRPSDELAVGYDSFTDTILLFGNWHQFVTFKPHAFTDKGEQYLTSAQATRGSSQHYMQLGNELWMIDSSGVGFVKADTETYTITVPPASFPITVNDVACLAGTDLFLFVIGGADESMLAITTTQIYRISDGVWLQNVPSLNTKRKSLSCIAHDNILFAIGGYDSSTYLESIETLDISNIDTISTKTWGTEWADSLISGRKGSRSVLYGTDIYVIGGRDNNGNRVDDINVINTKAGTVSIGDTLNYATSYASSIIVENTLCIRWMG